jgi:hypothetical protein
MCVMNVESARNAVTSDCENWREQYYSSLFCLNFKLPTENLPYHTPKRKTVLRSEKHKFDSFVKTNSLLYLKLNYIIFCA